MTDNSHKELTDRLAHMQADNDRATEGPWSIEGSGEYLDPLGVAIGPAYDEMPLRDAEFVVCARENHPKTVTALQVILDLHQPYEWSSGRESAVSCKHCTDVSGDRRPPYPCPTVRAITEAMK